MRISINPVGSFKINNSKNKRASIPNKEINFQGKEKFVTDSAKVLAAVTAGSIADVVLKNKNVTTNFDDEDDSAELLFEAALNDVGDPSKIIREFYDNENSAGGLGIDISRFSPEEQYDIIQNSDEITMRPKIFDLIIKAKKEDDSYKFNYEESMSLYSEIGEDIEIYPDVFKKIIKIKRKKDNEDRFSTQDYITLMKNADLIKAFPKAFDVTARVKFFKAEDCISMLQSCGEILNRQPEYLATAVKTSKLTYRNYMQVLKNAVNKNYLDDLMNSIESKEYKQRVNKLLENSQLDKAERKRIIADIEKKAINEKRKRGRAQKWEDQQREALQFGQQIGWISAEKLIDKVNRAVNNDEPLITENGEVIQDDLKLQIAENIKRDMHRAKIIIEMRYRNKMPIFNEKECYEILSKAGDYYAMRDTSLFKRVNKDNQPIYTPEQCMELLKSKSRRDIEYLCYIKTERNFTPEDVMAISRNCEAIFDKVIYAKFLDLVQQKASNGAYKYSINECIQSCVAEYESDLFP